MESTFIAFLGEDGRTALCSMEGNASVHGEPPRLRVVAELGQVSSVLSIAMAPQHRELMSSSRALCRACVARSRLQELMVAVIVATMSAVVSSLEALMSKVV